MPGMGLGDYLYPQQPYVEPVPVAPTYDEMYNFYMSTRPSTDPAYAAAVNMKYDPTNTTEAGMITDYYNKMQLQSKMANAGDSMYIPPEIAGVNQEPNVLRHEWEGNMDRVYLADGTSFLSGPYEIGSANGMGFMSQFMPALTQGVMTWINPVAGAAMSGMVSASKHEDLLTSLAKAAGQYVSGVGLQNAGLDATTLAGGVAPVAGVSPTSAGFQFGGAEPLLGSEQFAVNPGLELGSDVFSVDPSLALGGTTVGETGGYFAGGSPAFSVDQTLNLPQLQNVDFGFTYPETGSQIAPIGGNNPISSSVGYTPFQTNPALNYVPQEEPYFWGGGDRPFQVNQSLDPNARPIESSPFTTENMLKIGKTLSNIIGGGSGSVNPNSLTSVEEVAPGSASSTDSISNIMSHGVGLGKSKGLNPERFSALYSALSKNPNKAIEDYGNNTYYR